MLELKQLDRLRLQVDVPENIAGALDSKTKMDFYVSAFPGKRMSAQIARKSQNVNMSYRMERVEMDVWNHDGSLTPGTVRRCDPGCERQQECLLGGPFCE